jgi:hypothetical protein
LERIIWKREKKIYFILYLRLFSVSIKIFFKVGIGTFILSKPILDIIGVIKNYIIVVGINFTSFYGDLDIFIMRSGIDIL